LEVVSTAKRFSLEDPREIEAMTDKELERLEHDTLDELGGVMYRASLLHMGMTEDEYLKPVGPAQFREPLPEGVHAGLVFRIVRRSRQEYADASHSATLLRPRRQRPCSGAAKRMLRTLRMS
jgi:hypothetical protein